MSKIAIVAACNVSAGLCSPDEHLCVTAGIATGPMRAAIVIARDSFESDGDYAAFLKATEVRVTVEVVSQKGDLQSAQEDIAAQLSVAVGSTASRKVTVRTGTSEVPGEGGTEQTADLKATRNDRGGIDYELTVDPIDMGLAPSQVSS